eukprot:gene8305-9189_t
MERGLWGFTQQGQETPQATTESAAQQNAFRLRSDKAYSLIALTYEELTFSSRYDIEVIFSKGNCIVKKNGKEYVIGNLAGSKLYKMNTISEYAHVWTESCKPSKKLWHCRFGHVNYNYIDQMKRKEMVHGMDLEADKDTPNKQCEACILRKVQKKPLPKQSNHKATKPFQIIHSDVCGPMQVMLKGGSRYMLTFTDDYSRFVTTYFIKTKGEVFTMFKESEEIAVPEITTEGDKEPVGAPAVPNKERPKGRTYEESFMGEVKTWRPVRERRPPLRFEDEECLAWFPGPQLPPALTRKRHRQNTQTENKADVDEETSGSEEKCGRKRRRKGKKKQATNLTTTYRIHYSSGKSPTTVININVSKSLIRHVCHVTHTLNSDNSISDVLQTAGLLLAENMLMSRNKLLFTGSQTLLGSENEFNATKNFI